MTFLWEFTNFYPKKVHTGDITDEYNTNPGKKRKGKRVP